MSRISCSNCSTASVRFSMRTPRQCCCAVAIPRSWWRATRVGWRRRSGRASGSRSAADSPAASRNASARSYLIEWFDHRCESDPVGEGHQDDARRPVAERRGRLRSSASREARSSPVHRQRRRAVASGRRAGRWRHASATARHRVRRRQLLERSLQPSRLPRLPGVQLAARYVTAESRLIGGDWYDAFTVPSGQLGLVVGDVAGHGLKRQCHDRVKSALRAYALPEGATPRAHRQPLPHRRHRRASHAPSPLAHRDVTRRGWPPGPHVHLS